MGLGLGLGIWWPTQTSIIPGLLKALCARATYCENKLCTTATLEEIAAVRYTAPVLPTGLLADYPGASAAYSLRNLIDTTTSVVRVRRSSDNTEQDFTATEITDGTLTTFTGANDGFVTTWYDQSGNTNNVTQITAVNQPKLVDNGVVILNNGEPIFIFNNDYLLNSSININQPYTTFDVSQASAIQSNVVIGNGNSNSQYYSSNETRSMYNGAVLNGGIYTANATDLCFALANNTQSAIALNSENAIVGNAGSANIASMSLGAQVSGTLGLNGSMQEFIIYPTDQSANRTGIETNINNKYLIYPTSGLLADYPNASAAYSLRSLSNLTASVVRVRRDSDNVEQDFTAAQINDGTLATFCSGTDGFISIWYDQSRHRNNLSQTAATSQPKLVNNGVIVAINGKSAALFDGNNDYLLNSLLNISQPYTMFDVSQASAIHSGIVIGIGADRSSYYSSSGTRNLYLYSNLIGSTYTANTTNLSFALANNTQSAIALNGASAIIGNAGNAGVASMSLGAQVSGGAAFNGYVQEFIIYPTDQTANRTGIETNINTEYTIY